MGNKRTWQKTGQDHVSPAGGGRQRSGAQRTRPSAVQLVQRHESGILVCFWNLFLHPRVREKKARLGSIKHQTVQIQFYGAKVSLGKYYSLCGVNREQLRAVCVCVRGRTCHGMHILKHCPVNIQLLLTRLQISKVVLTCTLLWLCYAGPCIAPV